MCYNFIITKEIECKYIFEREKELEYNYIKRLERRQIHGDHHWREQLQITSMSQLSQCGKIRTSIGDTVINF